MTLTFGNVSHPPFVDRLIPDHQNSAWDDLGSRRPIGVCQHSMVGSLWGTDAFFRLGSGSVGLTDYGIGGATDGPQWDGVIVRWNDPRGHSHQNVNYEGITGKVSKNRAGWANGGANGLEGDGPLFVRTFGTHAINTKLVSIERSDGGDIATPMSPKQFESICALTAHWFDYANVRWHRSLERRGSFVHISSLGYGRNSRGKRHCGAVVTRLCWLRQRIPAYAYSCWDKSVGYLGGRNLLAVLHYCIDSAAAH